MFYCPGCATRYGLTMSHVRFPTKCDMCGDHDYCVREEESVELDHSLYLRGATPECAAQLEAS